MAPLPETSVRLPDEAIRQQTLIARMERLPPHFWQVKIRIIVGVATFFDGVDAMMLAYILPALIGVWKIHPGQIGLLIATGYIGQGIGAIYFGWLAEKHGRVRSLLFSVLLLAFGSLACAVSWNYTSLLVFRLIQGLGLGGEVPVAATYINEVTQAKGRARLYGAFQLLFTVGLMGAGAIAYFVIPHFGWQAMFIIGALPALMVPIYLRRIPESPRWLASKGRLDEAEQIVDKLESITTDNGRKKLGELDLGSLQVTSKATDWRELFQGIYLRRTLVLWVIFFLSYFLVYGLQLWVPTLFTSIYKVSLKQAIAWATYGQACGFVGQVIFAVFADRLSRRAWFILLFLGMLVPLALMWITHVPNAMTLAVLYCIFVGFMSPMAVLNFLYATEMYPTRIRALGISLASVWVRVAAFTGPLVVGFIYSASSIITVFIILVAIAAIGLIVSALFVIESRNKILETLSP